MDFNDFTFEETGNDLDLDIEEIIKQQMLALEEVEVILKYKSLEASKWR